MMRPLESSRPRSSGPILVAMQDALVAQVLGRALDRHQYEVRTAADGEQALQWALAQRPAAILADATLPRRTGLELCAILRRDPKLMDVPILLVSASVDPATRIEALQQGADEVLAKPFDPEEVVARLERWLVRAEEVQRLRRQSLDLERDRARLEADARRARETAVHEHDLRALVASVSEGLLRTVDVEALDARILFEVCHRTGARSAALLERVGEGFEVRAVRGDLHERWRALILPGEGIALEWARMVARPVRRQELERVHGAHEEVLRLARHGVA